MRPRTPVAVLLLLGVAGSRLSAQAPKEDPATALAKTTQNPVASLISLPFQFNFNSGGGLVDQTSLVFNFQPVIPIVGLLHGWSIIARTIVPYVSVPAGPERQSGLGDIQEQLFFTPARPSGIIWGIGPLISFPTATTNAVATGSWALGPAGLVLKSTGPWVLGALINNVWTFGDEGGAPKNNQFLLQPFVNFNFGKGWAATSSPIITANWDAAPGEEWTVPLGLGFSKTTVFNRQPINLGAQYYHNIEHPTGGPANLLRLTFSLLYPPSPKQEPPGSPAQ